MTTVMTGTPPHAAAVRGRSHALLLGLLLPIVAVNAIAFLAPMGNLLRMSLNEAAGAGAIREAVSLRTYSGFLTDAFYLDLIGRSLGVSLLVTGLTLLASYPIALFIHRAPPRWKNPLTILTISPLLVSAVVRTFGWMIILGDEGLVNRLLTGLGAISRPLAISNNLTSVIIGLTEILMPYMVLALMAGFGRLDSRYEEAAQSLGARPLVVFYRIVLPLSIPGIALGSMLAFVLAISAFITPKFLGGGKVVLLATEIFDQAMFLLNWPLAAAMSIFVLTVFGACLVAYSALVRNLE